MIRRATPADLDAIRACAIAAYRIYVGRIGREPAPMVADFGASIERGELDVIEVASRVAGFVVYYARADHVHLENVAVDPTLQGRRLGFSLVEHVENRARELGFTRVELYTNAKMTENLELYPRLGYIEFDRRIEDGFDRVYFSKNL